MDSERRLPDAGRAAADALAELEGERCITRADVLHRFRG